jgi:hypothetical protein
MNRLSIFHYVVFLAMLIGFVRIKTLPVLLKSFPFFLFITLFVECVTPLKLIRFHGTNHWFFNIFTTLEFIYYGYLFYHIIDAPAKRKVMPLVFLLFILFTIINIFYIQGQGRFHTISYRVGAIVMIVLCFYYFRQLTRLTGYINLLQNPYFWISTGILFFYLGFFFYFSAFDYIVYNKLPFNLSLWMIISNTLNVLLYSSFVIALLCPGKKIK